KLVSSTAGISSAKIVANDSDVSLYAYTGSRFDGPGYVFRCRQGQTCAVSYAGTGVEDRILSVSCQREFGRKALRNFKENPIINLKYISDAAVKKVGEVSSRIKWANATTTTMSEYEYCALYPSSWCVTAPASYYRQVTRLHV